MTPEMLKKTAEQFQTPAYLFDLDVLAEHVTQMKERLYGKAHLCFAIKANPFLTKRMSKMVDRLEVCSMGEYHICKELEIPPEKILISGVMKKECELMEILDNYQERSFYTAESLNQYQLLEKWSLQHQKIISVYLRLTSGNQFGMDLETIQTIIRKRKSAPYMNILGIHFFSGTQKKSMDKIEKELKMLNEICLDLRTQENFVVEELEYGPGLAAYYFDGQEDKSSLNVDELAEILARLKPTAKITLEMGRALSSVCGYYMTRIMDVKENDGKRYCIVDGGNHQINYDGQIRGMYRPNIQIFPEKEESTELEWTICGALCTVNDILVQKLPVANLEVGDLLCFERTGAYSMTEGMSLFLSHNLPQIVMYCEKEGWKQVRTGIATYQWNMEREN